MSKGEQNHSSFFILGVLACFSQTTQKVTRHFAAKAEKEGQEPVFPPSYLQSTHLASLTKGEWDVDAQQWGYITVPCTAVCGDLSYVSPLAQPKLVPVVATSTVNQTACFLCPCVSDVISLL